LSCEHRQRFVTSYRVTKAQNPSAVLAVKKRANTLRVNFSPERLFKTLHGWLGVIILPWIILIGFTGLYLNHFELVNRALTAPSYNEAEFDSSPLARQRELVDAIDLSKTLWPEQDPRVAELIIYHDREAWRILVGPRTLIVDAATGHYWVKTRFRRQTYGPDGAQLHSKIYWGSLFKTFHENGWFNGDFGTWLADITAAAMVLFGLSGVYLFTAPRLRRRKNRRLRTGIQ
jgi:hypothetical protein|tara:strand:- start:210 stop:902 length:693 start_codon:yes stop_codon:yes gene_type:complete